MTDPSAQVPSPRRALLAWSSGKDSAWALHLCRQRRDLEVVALFTTLDETSGRVGMHHVRRELVERQANATGLEWWPVPLPWPASNETYEARLQDVWRRAESVGIESVVFGDIFLDEIRAYRERQLEGTGLEPLFPLWGRETRELALEMLAGGVEARVVAVDRRFLGHEMLGRSLDADLLRGLPAEVDPCGERGEFHTFVHRGPMLENPVPCSVGEITEHAGFARADLLPQAGLPDEGRSGRGRSGDRPSGRRRSGQRPRG
ncbi:MAG: ATP-binding protein [Acidobacteriota bacterium]